jgi:uncharacterized lipoprotein NlpE involved in copper resistance
MKKLLLITTVAVLLTLFSCKRQTNKPMTVVRDCTGTYLRIDGKDFQVCNVGKLSLYSTGATVDATFRKIDNCKRLERKVVCRMLHQNEGLIEILKLK